MGTRDVAWLMMLGNWGLAVCDGSSRIPEARRFGRGRGCGPRAIAAAVKPWAWVALLALLAAPAEGGRFLITYNPYGGVDWSTTLRCMAQTHEHINRNSVVNTNDLAGYCAVSWLDYGGDCDISTGAQWIADGSLDPDMGRTSGFYGYRRWPPEDYGANAVPGAYANLKFWIPAAEEVGFVLNQRSIHVYSLGLTEYIDASGCQNCGPSDGPKQDTVDSCLSVTDPSHTYYTRQGLFDLINMLGGTPVLAHSPSQWDNLPAREMFNNLFALRDDRTGVTTRTDAYKAGWDTANDTHGGGIWGTAVNDRYGANPPLIGLNGPCSPNCSSGATIDAQDIDRGKIEVLLPAQDFASFKPAFDAGAFFAIVEDNATKAAYPEVTNIETTPSSIRITTTAGTETVTWIATGGVTVGTGMTLDFTTLVPGTTWVRAEVADGAGRTLYTQPFSLGPPVPSISPLGIAAVAALVMFAGGFTVTRPRA
jgi:hypothetical protein